MNIQLLRSRLVVSSGDNLVISDHDNDHAVKVPAPNLPPNLTKGQLEVLNKQDRTINSMAISRDGKYIAVSTENKQVVIYDTNLNVIKNFIVNRTASKVVFSKDGDIIVADRKGDVFLYKFNEETSEPTFLLGHSSMILDVAFSECGYYIVTCDRDEKIRVSRFPDTYFIFSYCLGHEEFVTAIKIVKDNLISASGDGTVRIWNYLEGEQLTLINTNQYVDSVNLLELFSKEMDKEKVDVTALPISDMQVYYDNNYDDNDFYNNDYYDNNLFIAVSIYNCRQILLFKVDLKNYESTYLRSIESIESPNGFYLDEENLYIFDTIKVTLYKRSCNNYFQTYSPKLEEFYKKYKSIFELFENSSVTVLYKRKFDNVQEYLERKKMRLESRQ